MNAETSITVENPGGRVTAATIRIRATADELREMASRLLALANGETTLFWLGPRTGSIGGIEISREEA